MVDGYDEWHIEISDPEDVLAHVQLGDEPMVMRDPYGDQYVYVSVESGCDWEPERACLQGARSAADQRTGRCHVTGLIWCSGALGVAGEA